MVSTHLKNSHFGSYPQVRVKKYLKPPPRQSFSLEIFHFVCASTPRQALVQKYSGRAAPDHVPRVQIDTTNCNKKQQTDQPINQPNQPNQTKPNQTKPNQTQLTNQQTKRNIWKSSTHPKFQNPVANFNAGLWGSWANSTEFIKLGIINRTCRGFRNPANNHQLKVVGW